MHKNITAVPVEIRTKLDNMNLTDRFLFSETAEDLQAYEAMVSIFMEEEIAVVNWTETEKELRISPQLRAVRLDVIGSDEFGKIYQTEMQNRNTKNLPKRSRYYQGQIDVSLLPPGCKDFNKLNDVTMILVTPFDVFGYGLYKYTFEEQCMEIPELKLEDGAKRIFINTYGNNSQEFTREFLDFMDYLNCTTDVVAAKSESVKIQQIHKVVQKIRKSEKMGVKFMQRWEELEYAKDDGREEGREEGRYNLLLEKIKRKLEKGKTLEMIADELDEEIATVRNIAVDNQLRNYEI